MSEAEVCKLSATEDIVFFTCPGCGEDHGVWVNKPNPANQARWTWNQSVTKPTFHPSILVQVPDRRCHSYVTDGNIRFLPDCFHELKGKTVPLPPWE